MRRWRVVVVDDNPDGSLEAVLLSPLVLAQPLRSDASKEQKARAIAENLLNGFLPLPDGETYATAADIDFQLRTFQRRRKECDRHPIIEVERDFTKAWRLIDEMAEKPPDIIFLDVMFDQKTSAMSDLNAIIDEISSLDRIGQDGRPVIREILSRGGLFLLGRLLRLKKEMRQMPLVVLYSASRDVQSDFRPFEYAFGGQFEVVEKDLLRNNPERRKMVFRRRIRDYLLNGTVRPANVFSAIQLLGTGEALGGDMLTLKRAFGLPVGGGWCFGSMFVADCVAYLSTEPSRRDMVLRELEEFISPLTARARVFANLVEHSPARLFSHGTDIRFHHRPPWLHSKAGKPADDNGSVIVTREDLRADLTNIQAELESAVRQLPKPLKEVLERGFAEENGPDGIDTLDTAIASLQPHDRRWEALLNKCRMTLPAAQIAQFVMSEAARDIEISGITPDLLKGKRDTHFELFLAPSSEPVKNPLADLLRAILNGVRLHGYRDRDQKGTLGLAFRDDHDLSTLEIELRDEGIGFAGLPHYELRGGDLSTALSIAAEWFDVTIASGGIQRRIASRGVGPSEPSGVTQGTAFFIRIPAVRREKEA